VANGADAQWAYGVEPSLQHTTGTGRLTWEVVPSGAILLEVWRPTSAGGSEVVVSATIRPGMLENRFVSDNERVVRAIEVVRPDRCHPRHMAVLLEAIFRVRRLNLLKVSREELRVHTFAGLPYESPVEWALWDPKVLSPKFTPREGWVWYGWDEDGRTWTTLGRAEGDAADYCEVTGELRLYSSPRGLEDPEPPFSTRWVPTYRVDAEIRYRRTVELGLCDPFED
jgi:hypothetical protein